ncbi:MAG TPA: single-stranded DNA-binding protein [Verrucomicrobia bacterium]|nr:MAG: single-stranded DNA-binding protein [Lentisphaerae bacterium GWF2_57_35]HBA84542.1 single-stranded DNA-binding protein [Verrucomicrobiota bacterium]
MKNKLIKAAKKLAEVTSAMTFQPPVQYVYNPLDYAWAGHEAYLNKFGHGQKRVIFVGMNPGPWGMAQTGVPFGEVKAVSQWMGLYALISKPAKEHPKRPIEGFDCPRSEVSGRRLWGLFAERFGAPENFFKDHFVMNYCPLIFMSESGGNLTPDKLRAQEAKPLFDASDEHLQAVADILQPEWVVGVGAFAEERLQNGLGDKVKIGKVLHPSPSSPAANRGWAPLATKQLIAQGIWS